MARFSHIVLQSANGVDIITLNRPDKRNALSPALIEELTKEKKLDNLRDKLHAALKEYAANFKAELTAAKA